MQLENGGITEQWNPTLSFPLLHLHETFGFHSSDSTVCRIVTQQLKHKPSADSKALHFCCRPAQHSFIPSRLCFERSGIWSQLARQIHFWQYAILPVWLTQNNSPQKAISTFTIQKSKPLYWKNNAKMKFSTSDTMFAQTAKLRFERSRLCLLCPIGWGFLIFIFILRKLQTSQKPVLLSMAKWSLLQGLKWHGGGLIIPQPHAACGCDMAINSGPRFNSVTKDRSVAPATFERGVFKRPLQWAARWGKNVLFQPFIVERLEENMKGLRSQFMLIWGIHPMTAGSMTDLESMKWLWF